MTSIIVTQRGLHDEELLEVVILPMFHNLHLEHEVMVRKAAVDLLISLCYHCNSKHCTGLLDILERIMERPFNLPDVGDVVNIPSDDELDDVVSCTTALINLFQVKIYQLPSLHAIQIYKLLVRHAHLHYEKPIYFEFAFATKLAVFEFILNITTDGKCCFLTDRMQLSCLGHNIDVTFRVYSCSGTGEYRLGYATNPRFSPYILIDHKLGERISGASRKDGNLTRTSGDEHSLTSHGLVTHMSLSEACMAVIRCLSHERDWRVLKLVLERIPRVIALCNNYLQPFFGVKWN